MDFLHHRESYSPPSALTRDPLEVGGLIRCYLAVVDTCLMGYGFEVLAFAR